MTIQFKKKLIFILLTLIILIGAFLRINSSTSNNKLHFTNDEARDALIIKDHFFKMKPFTVGPETSLSNSSHQIFFGPFFYYFIAPVYILSGFSYYSPFFAQLFVILLSVLTIYLMYYIGKEFYSPNLGLIMAFIYAISFTLIEYTWPWNPNPIPFFVCLLLLSIYRLIEKKDNSYWLIVGIIIGLLSQLHLINLLFYPILFVVLLWCKRRIKINNLFYNICGFILTYIPFIFEEITHNFPILKGYFSIFQGNKPKLFFDFPNANSIFEEIINRSFSVNNPNFFVFALIFLILISTGLIFTYKKTISKIIIVSMVLFYIMFAKFSTLAFCWQYSLPLASIIILSVGAFMNLFLTNKYLKYFGLSILFCFIIIISYLNLHQYSYWLSTNIPHNTSDLKYHQISLIIDEIVSDQEKNYSIKFVNYYPGNEKTFQYLYDVKKIKLVNNPKIIYVISSLGMSPYDSYIWKKDINLVTLTKIESSNDVK